MAKGGNIGKGKRWSGGGGGGGGGIIGGIGESGGKRPVDRSTSGVEAVTWLADCISSRLSTSASVTAPAKTKSQIFKNWKSQIFKAELDKHLN